ncbi:MAG TPA: tRNA (guanosine(46)-N7)-methyltransferase TrmB [Stellaceae bacterium]|nr:tRNA (guanosine(46)-N7)-methyltransferase TrmB [Stellaceae bacterium]
MDTLLPQLSVVLPPTGMLDPATLVPAANDLWLEIGFGAGEHLAAQARAHPDVAVLGAEVFENGIAKLLAAVDRDRLANVRLFVDDARLLLACLPDRSLGRAFILYPDPWPKERHKKRRIVAPETLDQLARTLRPGAELRLATDDPDYADWIAAALAGRADFVELAHVEGDWPDRPVDWPATRYEQKAVAAGRTPRFFRLARRA